MRVVHPRAFGLLMQWLRLLKVVLTGLRNVCLLKSDLQVPRLPKILDLSACTVFKDHNYSVRLPTRMNINSDRRKPYVCAVAKLLALLNSTF